MEKRGHHTFGHLLGTEINQLRSQIAPVDCEASLGEAIRWADWILCLKSVTMMRDDHEKPFGATEVGCRAKQD
jgi:hypothetical protein